MRRLRPRFGSRRRPSPRCRTAFCTFRRCSRRSCRPRPARRPIRAICPSPPNGLRKIAARTPTSSRRTPTRVRTPPLSENRIGEKRSPRRSTTPAAPCLRCRSRPGRPRYCRPADAAYSTSWQGLVTTSTPQASRNLAIKETFSRRLPRSTTPPNRPGTPLRPRQIRRIRGRTPTLGREPRLRAMTPVRL